MSLKSLMKTKARARRRQSTIAFITELATRMRQDILRVLKDSIAPLGPQEIAERTGYNYSAMRLTLRRMLAAQEIASIARGLYTTPHHPCLSNKITTTGDVTSEQVQHM